MQEWRTIQNGGPVNTIVAPNELFRPKTATYSDWADISQDRQTHVTWWSPGQYLIPGSLTRIGLRLGTALSLVAGISLLLCLLGWVQVARHFGLSGQTAVLLVLFLATFRYSTAPFGVYNGGEVLLQGVTPWIFLIGCRLPAETAVRAGIFAFLAIWIAFFAKLTGIIVASAALFAGSVEALFRLRRLTAGMIAGAVGAVAAVAGLYFVWFRHGTNPANGSGVSLHPVDAFFSLAAPWGAGVSWGDMLAALMRRSSDAAAGSQTHLPLKFALLLLVPVVIFAPLLWQGWRERGNHENLRRLLVIAAAFYAVCALAMIAIYAKGGDVSFEERHLRAAGTLIFFCVLAVLTLLPGKAIWRGLAVAFCVAMSLYGFASLAAHARSTKPRVIDARSRTREDVDPAAVEFVNSAFAAEGHNALFVLPASEIATTIPSGARVMSNLVAYEPEEMLAARTYTGKVGGHLYIMMPSAVADSAKGPLVLKEFVDYPIDGWQKHQFGDTTIFVQGQGAN